MKIKPEYDNQDKIQVAINNTTENHEDCTTWEDLKIKDEKWDVVSGIKSLTLNISEGGAASLTIRREITDKDKIYTAASGEQGPTTLLEKYWVTNSEIKIDGLRSIQRNPSGKKYPSYIVMGGNILKTLTNTSSVYASHAYDPVGGGVDEDESVVIMGDGVEKLKEMQSNSESKDDEEVVETEEIIKVFD